MVLSPYARQILVALSAQLSTVSMGGSFVFPSILLQQFKSKESSIQPDFETFTWIASIHGLAGLGGLLMPSLVQRIGRKRSFIVSSLLLLSGWCLAIAATNVAMILCSESLLGFGCNCIIVVNLMIITEMLAPKYRTLSMMLLGISQSIGIIFVTAVGTFLYWRILAVIMCSPVLAALIMVIAWPESPPWLAYKGDIGECEKAFKCLRGTDVDSMKELQELITGQKNPRLILTKKPFLKELSSKLKKRDFNIPILLMILLLFNVYMTGGVCLIMYGKLVNETATGDANAATIGFLIIDVNHFVGAIIALLIIRYFNVKTVLSLAFIRIIFLLCGSLVLFLQEYELLSKSPWIFISCYESYMLFYCSGLNTITFALAMELMPVKHRGVGGAFYNIFTCSLHFLMNKLLPYMILWLDIKGVFLFFAVIGIICHFLIWKYVPETKNRTLQEIEDYYNYKSYLKRSTLRNNDVHLPIIERRQSE